MRISPLGVVIIALSACPTGRPVVQRDQSTEEQLVWPGDRSGLEPLAGDVRNERRTEGPTLPDRAGAEAAPGCGPSSCPGCCAGGTCQPGNLATACGTGGAACAACPNGTCTGGKCVCPPSCTAKICGAGDGCGGSCAPGSGCLYLDEEFNGTALPTGWSAATGPGGVWSLAGGSVTLTASGANAWAELFSATLLPASSVLEARVNWSAGQWYDHKGIGYANQRVGFGCNDPSGPPAESEAAMWRGQDSDKFAEAASGGVWQCQKVMSNYPAGWHVVKVERIGTSSVKVYEDGVLLQTFSSSVPAGALPARFSLYTYLSAPAAAISLQIDWIKVKPL